MSITNKIFTLAVFSSMITPAQGQAYKPPALPNYDVDSFGVDLKSGRYVASSPVIVQIGDINSSISISSPVSTRGSSFGTEYDGSISFPSGYIIEVKYGNSTETFYGSPTNDRAEVIDYQPHIESGSILRRSFSGSKYYYTLALKNGKKYFFEGQDTASTGSRLFRITFPFGKQIDITPNSISNNFGFQVQKKFDDQSSEQIWQAVNNTVDICPVTANYLCQTSASRKGRSYNSFVPGSNTDDRTFEDAAGQKTVYRYKTMLCSASGAYCAVDLPVAIDFPGGSIDELSIEYNYPDVATRNEDDIMIKRVVRGDDIANYTYIKSEVPTGGYASRGFNLTTSVVAGNIVKYKALSITPPFSASSKKRATTQMLSYAAGDNDLVQFFPDNFGRVIGFKQSDGYSVRYVVDSRNNYTETVIGGKDLPDIKYKTTYPNECSFVTIVLCNLPSTITDPRGNVTEYTYNSYGQITSVTIKDTKLNIVVSKTTYSYKQLTATIRSSSNSILAAGPPISMIDEVVQCTLVATCADDNKKITRYIYQDANQPSNLLLKGISVTAKNSRGFVETQLTCFKYDYFGQEIEYTLPKGNVSTCM